VNLGSERAVARVDGLRKLAYVADVVGNRAYGSVADADDRVELDGYGYRWLRGRRE
jgi:hypothetical protein